MSKYVVVKLINPKLDACAHHPSGVATIGDGGDSWPVDAEIVSGPYADRETAWADLDAWFTDHLSKVERDCCRGWGAFEFSGVGRTIMVGRLDSNHNPCWDEEWVYKFLIVELPE